MARRLAKKRNRLEYYRMYRGRNKDKIRSEARLRAARFRKEHPRKCKAIKKKHYQKHRKDIRKQQNTAALEVKRNILTYYGPNNRLRCSFPGCAVTDLDMLTLDHINDDGAEHRRKICQERACSGRGTGQSLYRKIKRDGFVDGVFQTLCWNHQWKKEIIRKRQIWQKS